MKVKYVDCSEIKVGDVFYASTGGSLVELLKLAGREQENCFLEMFDRTKEKFVPWKKLAVNGKFIIISD